MPNLDIKETFLEKITSILSNHSENSVTLDLNSFENDDTLKYADLSLEMTLVDDTLMLKGQWDLENISDIEDEEQECYCDEDEDECCCFEDSSPCDDYDDRFDNFESFLKEDFEILDDSKIYLATESLLISELKLKLV